MAHFVTDRIVVGLQRTSAILAVLAVLVVVGGIGWTASADALMTAVLISVLAFGLPAVALVALAFWLDGQAASLEGQDRRALAEHRDEAARHPFREPSFGYAVAVLAASVAWGARALIDPYLPGSVPFITYFVAVAVSGWIGGYGPAVVTTALCACIARFFYMSPAYSFALLTPVDAVRLGSFVFVCLCMGGLTAALHAALRRVQSLSQQLQALKAGAVVPAVAPGKSASPETGRQPDTELPVA
jgi:K+-sensing histidine kinase KdpD